jgi:hypothetical protein
VIHDTVEKVATNGLSTLYCMAFLGLKRLSDYVRVYVCVCVCVCVCVYKYHIIYIHTYIYMCVCVCARVDCV